MEREPIPSQILLLAKALDPNVAALVDAMSAQGVPAASALGVLRQMRLVKEGGTPYKLARQQGHSREHAQTHAATAAYLAIVDYLGPDMPGYDKIVSPPFGVETDLEL
jgi:hypothetical protein